VYVGTEQNTFCTCVPTGICLEICYSNDFFQCTTLPQYLLRTALHKKEGLSAILAYNIFASNLIKEMLLAIASKHENIINSNKNEQTIKNYKKTAANLVITFNNKKWFRMCKN
jgi:hypothetical protein